MTKSHFSQLITVNQHPSRFGPMVLNLKVLSQQLRQLLPLYKHVPIVDINPNPLYYLEISTTTPRACI